MVRNSPIASQDAIAEIADKLRTIMDKHGPSSVALYQGTYSTYNAGSMPLSISFLQAIGSPMQFNSGTLDQPGKHIADALMGRWVAGYQQFRRLRCLDDRWRQPTGFRRHYHAGAEPRLAFN